MRVSSTISVDNFVRNSDQATQLRVKTRSWLGSVFFQHHLFVSDINNIAAVSSKLLVLATRRGSRCPSVERLQAKSAGNPQPDWCFSA